MMFGALDTNSKWLYFAINLMVQYPHVQSKIQKELDEIVGRERLPSFTDRLKMNYTRATFSEIFRYIMLSPNSLPRYVKDDIHISGYLIKKGSIVSVNLFQISRDERYFKIPHNFEPKNFLNDHQFVDVKQNLPFSIGKRNCFGESFAKTQLFLVLKALLQNFTFTAPEGEPFETKIYESADRVLLPYKICAHLRP